MSIHLSTKTASLVVFCSSLVLLCGSAQADSQATVLVSSSSGCLGPCTLVGGNGFTFSFTPGSSGDYFFTNATQTTWHSLRITETGYVPTSTTCMSSAFENCTVSESKAKNEVTVVLSGVGGKYSGVKPGQSLTIDLSCPHCGPNQTIGFTAAANVTPEPDIMYLFGTGLLLIGVAVGFRKHLRGHEDLNPLRQSNGRVAHSNSFLA